MSLPTVSAARIYKGQQQRRQQEGGGGLADYDGNSVKLSWENFPNVGLSMVSAGYWLVTGEIEQRRHLQTYNSDYMVPDSASTAFAMYSGVMKTTGYTMGYDNTIRLV